MDTVITAQTDFGARYASATVPIIRGINAGDVVSQPQALVQAPDVLLLDEPTNHLDLESINALNFALQKYEGTVLLVTHDHDLIEEVATRIWHIEGGRIEDFKGPYEEYVAYAQEKAS